MTILVFILVLGILVFVHEFGHFIVAKWSGVRVERFSLGFGPSIFQKKIGETVYQVACIPLGGYVKMTGEDASELEEGYEKEEEAATPVPPDRMFTNKSIPKRLAIVLAGPIMNFLLALILVPIVYMMGIEVDSSLYQEPRIGFVDPLNTAAKAGIQNGDLILRINGKAMENWKQVKTFILFHPNRELQIEVKRDNEILSKTALTQTLASVGGGSLGIYPPWPSRIKNILPGKPAALAGLQSGDLIIQIDELKDPHWFQTQTYIQEHPNVALQFVVKRGAERLSVSVTPAAREDLADKGFVGIEPDQTSEMRRFGFFAALKIGVLENFENAYTTLVVVGKLFRGDLKLKAVGGPVQIAEFTGAAAQEGFTHLLLFMAFISLQLGVMNLLPIPVLDGGHIAFMLIEALKGSPLSVKKRLIAQQVGMALLLTLMVVVTFNDVSRYKEPVFEFFKKHIP